MGSGKSTVASILRAMGYPVLDADQIVHKILSPGGTGEREIFRTFGQHLKNADGHLDRKALGKEVFEDTMKLMALEKLVHPLVRSEVEGRKQLLQAQGTRAAFYDVPLLFEKNMEAQFDHVMVVSAPEDVRQERVLRRSKMSAEEFRQRSQHHVPPAEKEARASVVIMNTGDLNHLENEVRNALQHLGVPSPTVA